MTILWRREMAVDGSVIDEDHKLLIEFINSFELTLTRKPGPGDIERSLRVLKDYAAEHFGREEELQRVSQYPFYDAHAREHRDLIKKLDGIIDHHKMAASRSDVSTVTNELIGLLKDWLVHHIIQSDLRMRPYVEKMKGRCQTMPALKRTGRP